MQPAAYITFTDGVARPVVEMIHKHEAKVR